MPNRILPLALFSFCLGILFLTEPAWANKFTTIGGGVSGTSREKIEMLKGASAILGCILTLLGVFSLVPYLHGASNLKTPKVTLQTSAILVIIGAIFIGLYFI